MKTVHLTVNGEPCSAAVTGRTQLAELLRDHLHLTGTHLGCEHGVCGACTVLLDGKPIRSCITCAPACEGAHVVTVEGLHDDPVGEALREAFTRHHALQCGFCTPGMLITARDIVTRLAPTSEAQIRHELAGNLCRCTGYMGIVAAVMDVARRHRGAGQAAVREGDATAGDDAVAGNRGDDATADDRSGESDGAAAAPFEPFDLDPAHATGEDPTASGSLRTHAPRPMTRSDGWSLIERDFTTKHPVDALWALFEDLPRVAQCLPGVHIESADTTRFPTRFAGRAEIHFGPVRAAFHGEGTRETDAAQRTGVISGRGADPRGQATLDAELRYAMSEEKSPDAEPCTRIDLGIRFRIQGGLAQFNRADLVESFADVMLAEFVRNCDRALAGEEVRQRAGGFALLWRMLRAKLGF